MPSQPVSIWPLSLSTGRLDSAYNRPWPSKLRLRDWYPNFKPEYWIQCEIMPRLPLAFRRTTHTRGNIEPAKQQSLSGKKTTMNPVLSIRQNLGEEKHIAADYSIPNRHHASGSIERHVPSGRYEGLLGYQRCVFNVWLSEFVHQQSSSPCHSLTTFPSWPKATWRFFRRCPPISRTSSSIDSRSKSRPCWCYLVLASHSREGSSALVLVSMSASRTMLLFKFAIPPMIPFDWYTSIQLSHNRAPRCERTFCQEILQLTLKLSHLSLPPQTNLEMWGRLFCKAPT